MKDVATVLNAMRTAGIILDYAVFGAVAQMRYTESVATLDADILVAVPDDSPLDLLSPIYRYCRERGYQPEGEAIRIGLWPVQFVPVFDDITRAALAHAVEAEFEGVTLRVVSADYLAVIALSVGRSKDHARVLALLESGATTEEEIGSLAAQHALEGAWAQFRRRFRHG